MPITWRNVDAPSNAGVAQLLGLGAANINTGFDKVGQVLAQREAINQDNWNQQKTNNTQAFMDALGEAKTPEEFQAKQAFLAQMRSGMGAQVDAAATRAAEDARLGILQQRAITNNTFNASMDAEHDRPIQDQITEAIYNKDMIKAVALKEQLRRGLGDVAKNIDARQEQLLDRDRAGKEFSFKEKDAQYKAEDQDMEKKLFPLKEAQLRASINESNASSSLREAQAKALANESGTSTSGKSLKEISAARSRIVEGGAYNLGSLGDKEGIKALDDHLNSKLVDPKDVPRIQAELGALASEGIIGKNGKPIPVPASYVLDAVRTMGERGYTGRWGNQVSDQVRERVLKDENKLLKDHGDILNFDLDTLKKFTGAPTKEQLSSTDVPTKNVATIDKKAAEVVPPVVTAPIDPKVVEADAARSKLKAEFVAAQKAVRDAGGIDVAPVAQLDTLKRITKALGELDVDTSTMTAKARKELSEQRRIADQEEALKKLLGR